MWDKNLGVDGIIPNKYIFKSLQISLAKTQQYLSTSPGLLFGSLKIEIVVKQILDL